MKEEKNIDRLFQEKFKDFEVTPDDKVWEGIASKLDKKRKKVIPLWLIWSGVAAILTVALLLNDLWISPSTPVNKTPSVVNQDTQETYTTPQSQKKEGTNSNGVVVNQEKESTPQPTTNAHPTTINQQQENEQRKAVSQTEKARHKGNNINNKGSGQDSRLQIQDDEGKNITQTELNTAIAENSTQKEENTAQSSENETQEPTLEEILKEEEAIANTDNLDPQDVQSSRWGVSPMVAPVYYNSFSGSGIDPQFNDNAKDGEVSLSYGLKVSYAVNDRLKVRTGVNKVNLSYQTGSVSFSPNVRSSNTLSSIDYIDSGEIVEVNDIRNLDPTVSGAAREIASSVTPEFKTGNLKQRVGYIEIPVEVEYAVVNSKLGLNLIGGVSTLFLEDNSISLTDGNETTLLGTSNSLNNTSFSTNIGLGLDYEFSKHIEFNLEPMFKYQLNGYKNSVSDFRPYYLGLYTGVNIKF